MANLTAEKLYTAYGPSEQFEAQMASASFFRGAIVGLDPATGFYNNMETGSPTLLAVGLLRHTYDNTGGTERNVADPGVYELAGTFTVATDQGKRVYAIDNQTVSTSSNSGVRPYVGTIVQVTSTTKARVKITPSAEAMAIFAGVGYGGASGVQVVAGTLVAGTVTIAAGFTISAASEVVPIQTVAITGSTNFGSLRELKASRVTGAAGVATVVLEAVGADGAKDVDAAGAIRALILTPLS